MASTSAATSKASDVKITLHWLEISRSHRIHWLLEELSIPYELKTYKRDKDKLAPPSLKQVHPLGKSPTITVESPARNAPFAIAESGAIAEFLCDHFGRQFIPKQWQDGLEGQVGGETESWLRYRTFMHYAEGSLMPMNLVGVVADGK